MSFYFKPHAFSKSPSPRDLAIGFNYRFNYRFNYKLVDKFAYRLSCRLSYWNVPGQPFGRRLQKARFLYKILLKFVRFRSFVWGGPSDKPAYSVLLCGCAVPCVRRWLFTWTALVRVCACVLHRCLLHWPGPGGQKHNNPVMLLLYLRKGVRFVHPAQE